MFGHNFISSEGNAGFLRRKPRSPPKKKTDTYVREAQHERTYRPTPPITSPHTNVCLEKKRQTRPYLTFINTFHGPISEQTHNIHSSPIATYINTKRYETTNNSDKNKAEPS